MRNKFILVAWNKLVESRGSTILYFTGLAIVMAISMLIGLWIHSKISYSGIAHN